VDHQITLDKIVEWAKNNDNVRIAVLTGSCCHNDARHYRRPDDLE
jgi:hypothetical protein